MNSLLLNAIKISIYQSLTGFIVGGYVAATAIGEGYDLFPLFAGSGAFIASFALWYFLIEKLNKRATTAGVLVGALSGVVSHYVCWYLFILEGNIEYHILGSWTNSLGDPPMSPVYGVVGAMWFTLFSLLFYGWVTVPIGAFIGGLFSHQQRKKKPQSDSTLLVL